MPPVLSGSVKVSGAFKYEQTTDLFTFNGQMAFPSSGVTYTHADAAKGATLLYSEGSLEVTSGADVTLDLAGALKDPLSNLTQTYTKLKGFWIKNKNTVAADILKVSGLFVDAWAHATDAYFHVAPEGEILVNCPSAAGYAVTATTGDTIVLRSLGANLSINLFIWGVGTTA